MRKLLLGALLLLSISLFSQTIQGNLIVDSNMQLGQNCGGLTTITYTGDLNFNGTGNILTLKGVNLVILGNINGSGVINSFCNNQTSTITYYGNNNAGNNITYLNGATLVNGSLSLPTFNMTEDFGFDYIAFDLWGRVLMSGVTDSTTYFKLPSKQVVLFYVEGYKLGKILKQ